MNYFEIVFTALGGLGIFFLGLRYLSESLQSSGRGAIKKILEKLTSNRIFAVLAGFAITAFVQSSSISTVMTVSLVNAGLMELKQAIGVILGANIGTTVTGWIISIKVGKYGLLLVGLGAFPMMVARNPWWNTIGKTLVALGLVFVGLEFMSGAFTPLRSDETFLSYLHLFDAETLGSLLACVMIGCLLTIIVQSSSAMLGITITLAATGVIDFETAVALVIGENIGTTITAQLAAIGTNTSAIRAARAHAIFNILGAIVFVSIFPYYVVFVDAIVGGDPNLRDASGAHPNIAFHIAVAHTMFNVLNVLLWIPLIGYLANLVVWLVPQKETDEVHQLKYLGTQSSTSPEVDLQLADMEMDNMVEITKEMFSLTRDYITGTQENIALYDRINHLENITDNIEEEMIGFVTSLLTGSISHEQSTRSYKLIRMADEIESTADSLRSLSDYRHRLFKSKETISPTGWEDFMSYFEQVNDYFNRVTDARKNEAGMAQVEALLSESRKLNKVAKNFRDRHMDRISDGTCLSIPAQRYSDMHVTLKRIKSHSLGFLQAYAGIA